MTDLISPEYRELMTMYHKENGMGAGGAQWLGRVRKLCNQYDAQNLLDYGCGKQRLGRALRDCMKGLELAEYDPAIPDLSGLPSPADIVTATDVMEHIEPNMLQAVLMHIAGLTRIRAFMTIATGPARKKLPDGRNAHLIQQDALWWMEQLTHHFDLERVEPYDLGLIVIAKPKKRQSPV